MSSLGIMASRAANASRTAGGSCSCVGGASAAAMRSSSVWTSGVTAIGSPSYEPAPPSCPAGAASAERRSGGGPAAGSGDGVEEALDDPTGAAGDPAVVVPEAGRGGDERAGEAGEVVGPRREGVDGAGRRAHDEPAVAGGAAERVRLPQDVGVLDVDGAGPLQGVEGGGGAGARRPGPELEQLRRPLHVGQRTGTELEVELAVLARRDALALDPGLEPADLPLVLDGEGPAPHRVRHHVGEPRAQLGVAGDRP